MNIYGVALSVGTNANSACFFFYGFARKMKRLNLLLVLALKVLHYLAETSSSGQNSACAGGSTRMDAGDCTQEEITCNKCAQRSFFFTVNIY